MIELLRLLTSFVLFPDLTSAKNRERGLYLALASTMSVEPVGGGVRPVPLSNSSDKAPSRGVLKEEAVAASTSVAHQPSIPATLKVNPRIPGMTMAGRGPPLSRMVTHQAPHGVFVPPPGIHGRHHYPMPRPPPHPQVHNSMVQHPSIITRHKGQRDMVPPPIVSASAATYRKKQHPPSSSTSPSNIKQGSEKPPQALSTRPPRWTENEVRNEYIFYHVPCNHQYPT